MPTPARPTIGPATTSWVRGRVKRGEITRLTGERYLRSVGRFIEHLGGPDVPLDAVTPDDFEEWLTDATSSYGRRYRPGSLNTLAAPVRTFFAQAAARGLIDADPTADTLRAKTPQAPPKRLTREAVRRLIDTAPTMQRVQIVIIVNLGLRLAELAQMRVEHWNRENDLLTVAGKGSKTRVLPLVGEPLDELGGWVDFVRRRSDGPLWPHPRTGEALSAKWIGREITAVGERCGVEVTPHRLRHTCASDMVEEGIDLAVVQQMLGHASLTSTSIYVSAAPEHLREAIGGRRPYGRLRSAG